MTSGKKQFFCQQKPNTTFPVAAQQVWNSLLSSTQVAMSLITFLSEMKTTFVHPSTSIDSVHCTNHLLQHLADYVKCLIHIIMTLSL